MKTILNIYRKDSNNIGDAMSSPLNYFRFPECRLIQHDLLDSVDADRRPLWEASFDSADCVVIGGGGLLAIDYFEHSLRETYLRRRSDQKFVLWGAGHNHYQLHAWNQLRHAVDLIPYNYDLIGVRDFDQIYEWVPCSSCMDVLFDSEYEIEHEIVLYKHVETVLNDEVRRSFPANIKIIDNYSPFDDVIRFLGSANIVLTSSFHGAYWATLLGRRVVAFPFSSKFYGLKHPVPLCDIRDWRRFSVLSRPQPSALVECRAANIRHHERVMSLLR